MMNKQEIFDTVVNHIANQKHRSMATIKLGAIDETIYICAYRGTHGDMCAVGCLIKDEDYTPEMETKQIDRLIEANLLPMYLLRHIALLKSLQLAHDSAFNVDQLTAMLRSAADIHELDASAVDNIQEWGD